MKLGDGLFLNTCRRIAEEYKDSGVKFNDMIVDNASMQMVAKPQQFDVLVMPNLCALLFTSSVSGLGPIDECTGMAQSSKTLQPASSTDPVACPASTSAATLPCSSLVADTLPKCVLMQSQSLEDG